MYLFFCMLENVRLCHRILLVEGFRFRRFCRVLCLGPLNITFMKQATLREEANKSAAVQHDTTYIYVYMATFAAKKKKTWAGYVNNYGSFCNPTQVGKIPLTSNALQNVLYGVLQRN